MSESSLHDNLFLTVAPCGGVLRIRVMVVSRGEFEARMTLYFDFDEKLCRQNLSEEVIAGKETKTVTASTNLPVDEIAIFNPVEILALEEGEMKYRYRYKVHDIVTVPREVYFQYLVVLALESLGFETDWPGRLKRDGPHIRASFKLYPTEVFQVECPVDETYGKDEMLRDYAKHVSSKGASGFTRLLIVREKFEADSVLDNEIASLADPVTLATYSDLIQLAECKKAGVIGAEEPYLLSIKRGRLKVEKRLDVDSKVNYEITEEILFDF